jgi:hypothetical protein
MEIPDIRIKGGDIDIIRIPFTPDYLLEPPQALQVPVPITDQIGVPVVDIPGCVEAHEVDENNMLEDADPKGVKVYCDGQTPSFNPIDYNSNKLKFQKETPVPPVSPPPEAPETNTPEVPKKVTTAEVTCPTEAQELKEPIGTLVEGGTKKIVEYRLVGKECIPVKEDIKIPDQIVQAIPTAGSITTTASIAVVATTSALLAKPLADLLLKVVKPTVKKVIKKIAAIRGKTVPVQSLKDRQDEQRLRNHAIRKLKGKE